MSASPVSNEVSTSPHTPNLVSAGFDPVNLPALQRSTDLARLVLRTGAAWLWAISNEQPTLVCGSGDIGLDASAIRDMLLETGPCRHDHGAHAWLGVAVRLGGGAGCLCVGVEAPRCFDEADVTMLQAISALVETLEDRPHLPLQALGDLSGALLREARDTDMPADALLAAADSLDGVARRLRELARPRSAAAPAGCGTTRILLADDLDLNRRLIADMLSLEGHRVDCVADGAAAVRAVTAERYDLVLMDMIMPEMDGVAATRAIRALPGPTGDIPIVALTANSTRDQLDSCLEAGMDAALTKPMSLDALTDAVARWTRGRHAA